ncbi:hypothetical protein JTB14_024855 [Gonioctena quinquepunctata]|nr:hypothetical protein JTB14_024855 [Gonioctena quinquepunctata]
MHVLNGDFSFPRENWKCNINVNITKLTDITDELIKESVTKALSDVLSDAAELGSTVEGEVTDINIMPIKKSDGREEVLEEVDSDDEAAIDDRILHVEDEDSNMNTVKNIIEHDTNNTAATSALNMDEILDVTNIASNKEDLSLKYFSGRINSERLSSRSMFIEVNNGRENNKKSSLCCY